MREAPSGAFVGGKIFNQDDAALKEGISLGCIYLLPCLPSFMSRLCSGLPLVGAG